ncbi:putative holo-[acyl-carrier-protein] synthase [Aeromicrobium marinum DSM 15272]|uniref:Holo-[acyl-carrier-protein] synthase n=1 Tax=Aeromicrobium marinum DSM 15272 TaxID=585531 RepID=E2SBC6_9ACTN|nr:holo-ACP synthase [Aeromicrobium marinum]EFQ83672.1 putative holo-[acyl-carrier-protein] synthase [Aeromicrobium marinum DSM 15272]
MTVVGVGVDLVHVPSFAEQLAVAGSRFDRAFTPGERGDARDRPSGPERHLAARWAAKEAVIKAWSASIHGRPPVTDEFVHHLVEVVTDAWNRPAIRLHGKVATHLADHTVHVSLSHDADYAIAHVTLTA